MQTTERIVRKFYPSAYELPRGAETLIIASDGKQLGSGRYPSEAWELTCNAIIDDVEKQVQEAYHRGFDDGEARRRPVPLSLAERMKQVRAEWSKQLPTFPPPDDEWLQTYVNDYADDVLYHGIGVVRRKHYSTKHGHFDSAEGAHKYFHRVCANRAAGIDPSKAQRPQQEVII